jgi:hypothetical protein
MILDLQKNSLSYTKDVNIYTTSFVDKNINNRLIESIKTFGDSQQRKTNAKAQMTDWNMNSYSGFNELSGIIQPVASSILEQDNLHNIFSVEIIEMWGLIYNRGDKTLSHDHIPCYLSGTYYVQSNKNNAPLVFPELNYSISPHTGLLVIFPSNLKHEVPAELSNDERIVVAFNIQLKK